MAGIAAFGTFLKRSDGGSPLTYVAIANVTTIGGPKVSKDFIDTTSHDSPDHYEEFVAGILKGGSVEIEGNLDPNDATHTKIQDDFDSGDLVNYQLVFPTSPVATWGFDCYVESFEAQSPHDGKLEFTAAFKISGAVDWDV